MLTLPAAFDDLRMRQATESCWILRLVTASTTIYLSTRDLNLTNGSIQVDGYVREFGAISHGVDVWDHSYQVNNVTVTLQGLPAERDSSGNWINVADVIRASCGRNADIFWFPGGYATGLSDCLQIFSGKVMAIEFVDDYTVQVSMDELLSINHRDLPQRKATIDIFPDLPTDLDQAPLPLVYGMTSEGTYHRGQGFNRCMPITQAHSPGLGVKYLVADHPVSAIGDVWVKIPQLNAFGKALAGVTKNTNDGGRATILINPDTFRMHVYLYPTLVTPFSTVVDPANPAGTRASMDYESSTKHSLCLYDAFNPYGNAWTVWRWEQSASESEDAIANDFAMIDTAYPIGIEIHRSMAATEPPPASGTFILSVFDGVSWVKFDETSTTQGSMSFHSFGTYYLWTGTRGTFWHMKRGPKGGDGVAFHVGFGIMDVVGRSLGTPLGYCHEIRLRIPAGWPRVDTSYYADAIDRNERNFWGNFGIQKKHRVLVSSSRVDKSKGFGAVYAEGDGRTYGSWIDNPGRSNSLNAGQVISHPAGIIESILRDELGLLTADIDESSFDTCLAITAGPAIVNPTHEAPVNSEDLLLQLCWEHGFYLYRSQAGKLKLIDYKGNTGPIAGTLYMADLASLPKVELSWPRTFANNLILYHTRLPHEGKFQRNQTIGDSGQQSSFGVAVTREERCETIRSSLTSPTATNRLLDRLIRVERIMSRSRYRVTLNTVGMKWAAVEIGDQLRLDSTQFDQVLKCMGDSWASENLMVLWKEYRETGVSFETIMWTKPTI